MPDVLVRPWSATVFAAYLDLGLAHPVFVGTADSEDEAVEWGRIVLADEDGSLENRCGALDPGGVSDQSEHTCVGELTYQSDEPTCVNTPARLAPGQAGATA